MAKENKNSGKVADSVSKRRNQRLLSAGARQARINIGDFVNKFNESTRKRRGYYSGGNKHL